MYTKVHNSLVLRNRFESDKRLKGSKKPSSESVLSSDGFSFEALIACPRQDIGYVIRRQVQVWAQANFPCSKNQLCSKFVNRSECLNKKFICSEAAVGKKPHGLHSMFGITLIFKMDMVHYL